MHKLKKRALLIGLMINLSACTIIDDYMLGKDNTPKPKPLPVVNNKHDVHIDWSAQIGSFVKGTLTPDLQAFPQGKNVYVASAKGDVYAFKQDGAARLWQKNLKVNLLAGPVVQDRYVIVNGDDSSLYILDKSDGHLLQRVKLQNDAYAKPLIIGHTVFVKTINGAVYSIDLPTAKKNWRYDHGSPEIILKASSSPIYYQGAIICGFSDGALVGLDPNKGHPLFQQHIAFPRGASDIERLVDVDTNPLVDGHKLYVASYQGEIGAYSLEEGAFIWHKPASSYHDLAFDDRTLVMVSSRDKIWAYDKQNGTVLWKQNSLYARGLTAPVIWQNLIWVGDSTGVLHAINPLTGHFVSQHHFPGGIVAAMVPYGANAFIITTNGQLHRLSFK
ncbi:MAG: outer membrane protein assembly factor BamB [Gammaproteobacteria bacterium]|nr:outer membrane protein assembly factor BamB [Gammaproteobacteria bacterium]